MAFTSASTRLFAGLLLTLAAPVTFAACVGDSTPPTQTGDDGGTSNDATPSGQTMDGSSTVNPTTDAGTGSTDASQTSMDADISTTLGAVHAIWTLKGATSGSTLTCAQVTGQTGVLLTLTPKNSPSPIDKTFPCGGNTGDYVDVPLGMYTVSGSIINNMSQALGTANPASLDLESSPCDSVVSHECTKNLPITILVDGQ
jgi:hypothetical protein